METFNLNVKRFKDQTGKLSFTKAEVKKLIKEEKVLFKGRLLCRIGDYKVIGEIIL